MIICHIINSLNNGGAENILLKLCKYSDKKIYKHHVISLIENGDLKKKFVNECTKVHSLNFKKNIFFIYEIYKLYKLIKEIKPNILKGWMYHSILLTSIVGKLLKVSNIYWNIRHTELVYFKSSIITIFIAKILSYISHNIPNRIIYCSEESKNFHNKFGFSNKNSSIIYNGVDINLFKYSKIKRDVVRKKFNIPDDFFIIGMFANYRLQKKDYKWADKPHKFVEDRHQENDALFIPTPTSERRLYLPIGYYEKGIVITGPNQVIYKPPLYYFAILSSRMHKLWVETVGGKLKTDLRYSIEICYNTFPIPDISSEIKNVLKEMSLKVLVDERERHFEKTILDLYDPEKMPKGL